MSIEASRSEDSCKITDSSGQCATELSNPGFSFSSVKDFSGTDLQGCFRRRSHEDCVLRQILPQNFDVSKAILKT